MTWRLWSSVAPHVVVCAATLGLALGMFPQEGTAASAQKTDAISDIGVLVLPLRPPGKSVAAPQPGEDAGATSLRSSRVAPEGEAELTEPRPDSGRKVVPMFYGDFAPASQAKSEETLSQPEAMPSPTEEASSDMTELQVPTSRGQTSVLVYDRTREIFRNLVPSATSFMTDYRRRPANCPVPLVLRGKGLGGRDLPIGGEDPYRDQLPANFMPTDLVLLPAEYCYANQPIYLRREAAESLVRMVRDAQRQGLTLKVVSGYRDYEHQQRLYSQNGGRRASRTVGRPGKSEHMLGTTVDLTSTERYLLKPSFANTPEGKWLSRNAGRYGWKLTVVSGNRVIEPWHFRYFGKNLRNAQGADTSRDSTVKRALKSATAPVREGVSKPLRAAESVFEKIFKK